MNYLIIKAGYGTDPSSTEEIDSNILISSTHTITTFLKDKDLENIKFIYIHYNDVKDNTNKWMQMILKCQRINCQIFYFTGATSFENPIVDVYGKSHNVMLWMDIKDSLSSPATFKVMQSIAYLCSFSILAQGYLISHHRLREESFNINESYDSVNYSVITNRAFSVQKKFSDCDRDDHEVNKNDVVEVALEQMGWNTFRNSSHYAEIIHTDLSKKELETQKRSWWLEPFDIDCSKFSDDEILTEINKIRDQIVKEWNEQKYGKVCSCINELIDALKKTSPIEDPTIVANAYLAISRRLTPA